MIELHLLIIETSLQKWLHILLYIDNFNKHVPVSKHQHIL